MKRGSKAARSLPAGKEFSYMDEIIEEYVNPNEIKNTPARVPGL